MLLLPAETLPWRRLSDLHVTLAAAVAAMLAWRLDKERLSEMFHQEEGRYGVCRDTDRTTVTRRRSLVDH